MKRVLCLVLSTVIFLQSSFAFSQLEFIQKQMTKMNEFILEDEEDLKEYIDLLDTHIQEINAFNLKNLDKDQTDEFLKVNSYKKSLLILKKKILDSSRTIDEINNIKDIFLKQYHGKGKKSFWSSVTHFFTSPLGIILSIFITTGILWYFQEDIKGLLGLNTEDNKQISALANFEDESVEINDFGYFTKKIIKKALKKLQSSDSKERQVGIELLQSNINGEDVPEVSEIILDKLSGHSEFYVRASANQALSVLFVKLDRSLSEKVVHSLLKMSIFYNKNSLDNHDKEVRTSALDAIHAAKRYAFTGLKLILFKKNTSIEIKKQIIYILGHLKYDIYVTDFSDQQLNLIVDLTISQSKDAALKNDVIRFVKKIKRSHKKDNSLVINVLQRWVDIVDDLNLISFLQVLDLFKSLKLRDEKRVKYFYNLALSTKSEAIRDSALSYLFSVGAYKEMTDAFLKLTLWAKNGTSSSEFAEGLKQENEWMAYARISILENFAKFGIASHTTRTFVYKAKSNRLFIQRENNARVKAQKLSEKYIVYKFRFGAPFKEVINRIFEHHATTEYTTTFEIDLKRITTLANFKDSKKQEKFRKLFPLLIKFVHPYYENRLGLILDQVGGALSNLSSINVRLDKKLTAEIKQRVSYINDKKFADNVKWVKSQLSFHE